MEHYLLPGQLRPHHVLCLKVSFLPGLIMARKLASLPHSHPVWLTCSDELSYSAIFTKSSPTDLSNNNMPFLWASPALGSHVRLPVFLGFCLDVHISHQMAKVLEFTFTLPVHPFNTWHNTKRRVIA